MSVLVSRLGHRAEMIELLRSIYEIPSAPEFDRPIPVPIVLSFARGAAGVGFSHRV